MIRYIFLLDKLRPRLDFRLVFKIARDGQVLYRRSPNKYYHEILRFSENIKKMTSTMTDAKFLRFIGSFNPKLMRGVIEMSDILVAESPIAAEQIAAVYNTAGDLKRVHLALEDLYFKRGAE